jgi:hypothetical protein
MRVSAAESGLGNLFFYRRRTRASGSAIVGSPLWSALAAELAKAVRGPDRAECVLPRRAIVGRVPGVVAALAQ